MSSAQGSTLTVFGARMPLRDGEIILGDDYAACQHWFVGGQSERSYTRAWQLMESLLDAHGWRLPEWFGTPHPCASLRFGNCLALTVEASRAAS